ncbi:MAG: MFS transporter [Micrococcales bacterium]|nr:MFS transporter [Micrococcales bacterium]
MSDRTRPSQDEAGPAETTEGDAQDQDGPWLPRVVWFLAGQAVSLFGSSVVAYAIVWHVALETRNAVSYAVVAFAAMVPQGLMSLVGGVWADRYDRKALVIAADAAIAVITVGLAWLLLSGHESLWLITAALVLRGIGGGVQTPAVGAILPSITPEKHLLRVNSAFGSVQSAVYLVAPAVAAVVLVVWEMGAILLVDVATAAVAIAVLAVLRIPATPKAPVVDVEPDDGPTEPGPEPPSTGLGAAWRFVLGHPGLRRALALGIVVFALVMPMAMAAPIVVVKLFGDATWMLAAVEIGYSGALILGGVVLAAWGGWRNRMTMIIVATAAWAVFTVAQGLTPWALLYLALWIPFGLVGPALTAVPVTVMQEETPPHLIGRVMGLMQTVLLLVSPVVLLVLAPLLEVVSPRVVLVVTGVAALVATARLARQAPPLMAPDEPDPDAVQAAARGTSP